MSTNIDPTELQLTPRERDSDLWRKLQGVLQARLDLYRRQNDNDLAPDLTANKRGRIQELKNLLAAGESQDQQP